MANVSYIKKNNDTWTFTIREGQKYLYSRSGFKNKEDAEEEARKAMRGIESVGYGRGFYLMSPGMSVADLCHIWIDHNPSTSEAKGRKDNTVLKIVDEYFCNDDVLEMTFDDFQRRIIYLQYDIGIKVYLIQHLISTIKNALFFMGIEDFTKKK